jgi:hypothetical protein
MATPTTSAGTILTPSGTTGLNRTVYSAQFFRTTYQRQILVPIIEDAERLYGATVLRKEQRVQGAVLAQSSDGTGVTYVNPVGSPVTVSPAGYIVPIGWSENEDAQVDFNMDMIAGNAASSALAELLEATAAANFQSATQIIANPVLDAATLRAAIARLDQNTNGESGPGQSSGGKTINGFFASTQRVPLMSIPEVNSAEARGDSENPYVKGVWVKGFGILANISSVVAQDANGFHNAIFLAEALTARWNVRSRIKRQDYEYRNGYFGYANFGTAVVYDARIVVVRTQ